LKSAIESFKINNFSSQQVDRADFHQEENLYTISKAESGISTEKV
jgi:hypothetical protein